MKTVSDAIYLNMHSNIFCFILPYNKFYLLFIYRIRKSKSVLSYISNNLTIITHTN